MLKTVVLLFLQRVISFIQDSLIKKGQNNLFKIVKTFIMLQKIYITFDQLNASLLNNSINLFKNNKKLKISSCPQLLNSSINKLYTFDNYMNCLNELNP